MSDRHHRANVAVSLAALLTVLLVGCATTTTSPGGPVKGSGPVARDAAATPLPGPIQVGQSCNVPAGSIGEFSCADSFGAPTAEGTVVSVTFTNMTSATDLAIGDIPGRQTPVRGPNNGNFEVGLVDSQDSGHGSWLLEGTGPATVTIATAYPVGQQPTLAAGQTCSSVGWFLNFTPNSSGHPESWVGCQDTNQWGAVTQNVNVELRNTGTQTAVFNYYGLHGDADIANIAPNSTTTVGLGAGHYIGTDSYPGNGLIIGQNSGDPQGYTTITIVTLSPA